MKNATCLLVSAAVALFTVTGTTRSEPPADARLQARLDALQAQLDHLEAQRRDEWLSERRAAEIRGLVEDVLADVDTRASLLQGGMTAGHDGGFFLASSDGAFRLNIKGVLQFRFVYNRQDDGGADSNRWGFENKRTALKFGGHVGDPSWQYFVQGLFSSNGGTFFLLDAFITKDLGEGWSLRVGKFRLPFLHEQIVNYTHLLTVERSLLTSYFGAGRSQGVQVAYTGDQLKLAVALSDDIDRIGGVTAPALAFDTEYTVTGRVECLLQGAWATLNDFSSFSGDDPAALLGGAIVWTKTESGTPDPETETFRWTLDGTLEFGGGSLYAAAMGNHTDTNGPGVDVDQYGALVQGGLFLADDLEAFARFEWGDEDGSADDLSVVTVGLTRYWNRHALKWVNDVGFAFNEVTGTWANAGAGWRADPSGEDGQVVIRSQLQMLF
jgi:hypothetical protein